MTTEKAAEEAGPSVREEIVPVPKEHEKLPVMTTEKIVEKTGPYVKGKKRCEEK